MRVRFKEANKEPIKEVVPAHYLLYNSCPEGLYDPEEDLEEKSNTEGIANCTKRLFLLRELDIGTLTHRRNEC